MHMRPMPRSLRRLAAPLAVLALYAAAAPGAAAQPAPGPPPPELVAYPNLILYNGKVLTVDSRFTIAEAVAIRDGRILSVGTTAEVRRLAGPDTRSIDLAGRTLVPGFIDSDGDNAFAGGDLYKDTMVNGKIGTKVRAESVPEMLKMVAALVAQAAPGSPVWVRMADEWVQDLSKLTVRELDALAPKNPLMLSLSSSEGLVNTLMLDRAFAAGLPRGAAQVDGPGHAQRREPRAGPCAERDREGPRAVAGAAGAGVGVARPPRHVGARRCEQCRAARDECRRR